MRSMKSLLLSLVLVACTVGTESSSDETQPSGDVTFVDSDGDGISDGIDTDGDGDSDRDFQACPSCPPPGGVPVCLDPLVDLDGDGWYEGLDLNCDGTIDISFDELPPDDDGHGGGGNTCTVTVTINNVKEQVTCTNGQCECRLNDVLEKTCTASSSDGCSFPGNCCGY